MSAEIEFEQPFKSMGGSHDGVADQLLGKRCLKVGETAIIATAEY